LPLQYTTALSGLAVYLSRRRPSTCGPVGAYKEFAGHRYQYRHAYNRLGRITLVMTAKPVVSRCLHFVRPSRPTTKISASVSTWDKSIAIPLRLNCLCSGAMSAYFFALGFPSFSFHFNVMFRSMLYSVFVIFRLFVCFKRGGSSPDWVKPATEGGGLSGIWFLFKGLFFVISGSVICFLFLLSTG
jgi:hypothetical protein